MNDALPVNGATAGPAERALPAPDAVPDAVPAADAGPWKRFWDDPYRCALTTRVKTVAGGDITLCETIFYALSGGQESDAGTIGGHAVQDARTHGHDIVYRLAEDHGLVENETVEVRIDWARRYRLMRLHFAAELVLELVYQHCPGITKIGAHISPEKARIDFDWPASVGPLLPGLQSAAQAIISADQPITSAYSDRARQRRYWKIEGFAAVPCGGTHLRRTGEVGLINLRRKNIGKAKERIEITVPPDPSV